MEEDTKNDTIENDVHPVQNLEPIQNPTANNDNKEHVNKRRKFFLTKLWHGEYSLPVTFWVFGILVSMALKSLIVFIKRTPIVVEIKRPTAVIIFIIMCCYEICLNIGTWRAANKYNGPKIWNILAKICVYIWWMLLIAAINHFIDVIYEVY